TRFLMLTERERFVYYHHRAGSLTPQALYNAGSPSWRQVRHAISPEREQRVRKAFWRAIGYGFDKEWAGWWIAWVPEQGHFELNIPSARELPRLQATFLARPPQGYRYIVLDKAGNRLR
ncbi:MAG: phosphoribosylaminoimidazolesuccinocarboxamide synthase, partial [Candidatus Melainabacteria bacterium HGW-Melainabacteria-1]